MVSVRPVPLLATFPYLTFVLPRLSPLYKPGLLVRAHPADHLVSSLSSLSISFSSISRSPFAQKTLAHFARVVWAETPSRTVHGLRRLDRHCVVSPSSTGWSWLEVNPSKGKQCYPHIIVIVVPTKDRRARTLTTTWISTYWNESSSNANKKQKTTAYGTTYVNIEWQERKQMKGYLR